MGTTLTALQSGQARIVWVAAIEGFEYLLTDYSDTAAVLTAWAAATEWSQCSDGLTVKGDWHQKLDPWSAFASSGSLQLGIQPKGTTALDDITIPMFKNAPTTSDVYLTADLVAAATIVNVEASAGLTSPVNIGNERITFSGTTATTLTGCTRGRMHPFSTEVGTANRFSTQHRATTSSTTVQIRPIVSNAPRSWIGKWVGLWAHRVVGGVLDTKAEAQLVFAGRIAGIADDANTGCAIIDVKHVLDVVKDTVIGRDAWRANVAEGVRINAGEHFEYRDRYDGVGWSTADQLVCVVGASGVNEIEPGRYTVAEIADAINAWLAAENAAINILGSNEFSGPVQDDSGAWSMRLRCTLSAAAATQATYHQFGMPSQVLEALGWDRRDEQLNSLASITVKGVGPSPTYRVSNHPPLQFEFPPSVNVDQIDITDEVGTFEDQYATAPPAYAGWADTHSGGTWGFVRWGDSAAWGKYSSGQLVALKPFSEVTTVEPLGDLAGVRYGTIAGDLTITQMFCVSGGWADIFVKLLASTGTSSYNSTTYDTLPGPMAGGIPWSLLGSGFVDSCQALDAASFPMMLVAEKPMTIAALLGHDLIARRAGLVFKNGTLKLARWVTPNAATAEHTLNESNKAAPPGTVDYNRSPTVIDGAQQRCTVKLEYNRVGVTSSEYRDSITLQDRAAIDDAGGEDKPVTISLRNTYANIGGGSAASIDALATEFLASMPLFSRPLRLITRSMALTHFEGAAPGDVASLTDSFARDPDTGLRGLSARKGLIVEHRYDFGGAATGDASSVGDLMGECTIMLFPDDRTFLYAPTAQVDYSVSGGGFSAGYNSGTLTLQFLANEHTSPTGTPSTDLASFIAGDKVRIIEIDPATPGAELNWARTLGTVTSTTAVVSSALTGFDSAKRYRMVPDDYATSTTFQSKAYQADSADSLIVDTARAHQYAMAGVPILDLATDTDLPERHPSLDIGDGKPYTTGSERGMVRMLNNLCRSKTRHSSAGFFPSAITAAATAAGDYDVLGIKLIRLRKNTVRSLEIAPYFRSATGASVTLRITVCESPPAPAVATDPDNNLRFTLPYQQATWTTSSTTYQTGTAATFSASTRNATGLAWVIIEGTSNAQTYGLAQCSETVAGDRLHDMTWCKNGDAPNGQWVTTLLNKLLLAERQEQKELFSAHGSASWPSSGSTRTRWRFEARTGTGAARFGVTALIAPATSKSGSAPTVTMYALDVAAGTTTTLTFLLGTSDPFAAFAPIGDCFFGTKTMDCLPSKRYQFYFEEADLARLVAVVVYELPPTTPALYPLLGVGSPIYSAHRTRLLGGATDAWNNNGSVLFHWCVDLDASPRTNNTTTARNLIDDTSTAVSASTPGFIPPLSNARTLMQTGASVVVAVYGTPPAGGGTVTIKDDTGTTLITVTLTAGGALGWYTATGVLPAVDGEKYDIHFVKTSGGGNISVGAVSIYQYG